MAKSTSGVDQPEVLPGESSGSEEVPAPRGIRPIVTLLEERTLLSTLNLTVTTLADDPVTPISGQTTLRDAITQANDSTDSQEIINFAPGLQGTIDLTQALPELANYITIQGPGASNLTVQRDSTAPQFSAFAIQGWSINLSGMTITGGSAVFGGGILNDGTLTLTNSTFTNNTASGDGGGILNDGTLTLTNSTFTNNTTTDSGSAIYNPGTLTVTNSTFTNNTTTGVGSGIYNSGTLTVTNSTFTNNTASDGGGIFNFGTLTVTNSTFTNNTAIGGGVIYGIYYEYSLTTYSLTLNNTIVAGNVGADISGHVQPTSKNNLIGNGTGITNLTQLDPSNLIGTTADPLNPGIGPRATASK